MRAAKKVLHRQSGIALLTTLLLMVLMSSMLVGFVLLINSGQKLSGMNNDYGKAFYSAEAGMEKLTADLGTLFDANYAPPKAQVDALQTAPPALAGVTFVNGDGTPGYTITSTNPVDANGNYLPTVTQITSGTYQGMTALATPYLLSVTARTSNGSEVKLQRTTQTVGIPMFQFGVYCDADCSFFAGPNFDFGGRTHTNGNLFLASGATLTMRQNVSAYKDVITYTLENGNPVSNGYPGTVNVFNGSGTLALSPSQGSLQQGIGSPGNPNWPNLSLGASNFAGNLRNGLGSSSPLTSTGAQLLQLGIVTLGGGATQSVDVIRRPPAGEAPPVTQERYFAQASLKILLSDNPNDLIGGGATGLPCTSTTTFPFDLTLLTAAPTDANAIQIKNYLTLNHSETYVPIAQSGAFTAGYTPSTRQVGALTLPPVGDGYWIPKTNPLIHGYIKIEVQVAPYNACSFQDVTEEVLGYGYVGKNANPMPVPSALNPTIPTSTAINPVLPLLPTAPVGSLTATAPGADKCPDGHPLAIIRLQRIRDNPSFPGADTSLGGVCGTTTVGTVTTINAISGDDFWPNVLYDAREGLMNNNTPPNVTLNSSGLNAPNNNVLYDNMVALGGVMQYVELDMKNVAKYLAGNLGAPDNGHLSYDPANAPNNYVVYISDRRNNNYSGPAYGPLPAFPGNWPPLSPKQRETGEYGFDDVVNTDANGCPNGVLDTGEDLDGTGVLYNYGQFPTQTLLAYNPVLNPNQNWLGGYGYMGIQPPVVANIPDPKLYGWAPPPYGLNGAAGYNCGITTVPVPYGPNPLTGNVVWSGTLVIHANEARQNPNPLFRRAVKLVNGSDLISNLGPCPGGVTCGLTVAAENPVYIQGDFNCPACSGTAFNNSDVGASVAGDAVTVLSNAWNDVNSFTGPPAATPNTTGLYNLGNRVAITTYYRAAIIGGKGVPFPELDGVKDFGTDGGVHNFMRELENWGAVNMYYTGSLVCLFTNRQAVGLYKSENVYSPPVRNYSFDSNFLNPSLLPPRTPLFRDVNTTGFTQLLNPGQ
jgi:Tfp pilus assembly protein PilX